MPLVYSELNAPEQSVPVFRATIIPALGQVWNVRKVEPNPARGGGSPTKWGR